MTRTDAPLTGPQRFALATIAVDGRTARVHGNTVRALEGRGYVTRVAVGTGSHAAELTNAGKAALAAETVRGAAAEPTLSDRLERLTTHTVEDCGCELGTPVQQGHRHGPVCTGCGKQVEQ